MVKEVVDKIFFLGTEDMGKDLAVVIPDNLRYGVRYVICEGEGVVIEVREKNTLSYIFEAVGDD